VRQAPRLKGLPRSGHRNHHRAVRASPPTVPALRNRQGAGSACGPGARRRARARVSANYALTVSLNRGSRVSDAAPRASSDNPRTPSSVAVPRSVARGVDGTANRRGSGPCSACAGDASLHPAGGAPRHWWMRDPSARIGPTSVREHANPPVAVAARVPPVRAASRHDQPARCAGSTTRHRSGNGSLSTPPLSGPLPGFVQPPTAPPGPGRWTPTADP